MKLIPYRDLIKLSKDKAQELLAGPRAKEQRIRAELEIAKIDSELASKEQALQELGAAYPINFDRLISTIDEIGLLERRRKQFQKIVSEMFPA